VGNSYTAEFWEYDPRIGRRWNLDPRPVTGLSEYSAFNGNPIMFSDPLGDSVGPGVRIPMIDRIPSGGSIKAGIGNFLYNTLAGGANTVTGALNTTADYVSTAYNGGLPGLMNKVDDAYRSVSDFVGGQYSYFANTSGAQIKADTKQFFSNPDNYFQAAEQAVLIGGVWKLGLGGSQTQLAKSTATDFSLSESTTVSRFESSFTSTSANLDGSFSILNWEGYPSNIPKPKGPFKLIAGDEYAAARTAADKANGRLRVNLNLRNSGVDIHEVIPVKFGGSPTNINNKIFIQKNPTHIQLNNFWKRVQRNVESGQ